MPSSRPNTIPTIIHLIRQLRPRSILDVGVGFGKWGHLFREYTDINEAENDPSRYDRKNWKVRIDGIEGYAAYLTAMHRYLYNEVHVGDACQLVKKLPRYDVVFMGDVIEHLDKKAGQRLLREAVRKSSKAVIVSTPKYDTGQSDLCGNELERHRSLWSARDFETFDRATVKTIDGATLLAVIVQPGIPLPACTPPLPPNPAHGRRLIRTKEELRKLLTPRHTFILVDEENIRGGLPGLRAIPFLEKNGQYWGPPADDETAVREFERLRQAGASYIAFAWPAFWWLEHYAEFARHLRSRFRCVVDNQRLVVFDLRRDG